MNVFLIVAGMMLATVLWSGLFWRVVMPRFARKQIRPPLGILLCIVFGSGLIAIPVASYFFLPEPTLMLGGLLVIAWCLAVRASTWVIGRKYVAPVLMRPESK